MKWEGNAFRDWMRAQEEALHKQARIAGLLGHSSSIGTAREFLVKRFLEAVLPPSVHIGSGIIIDANDNQSKQIDIILFDSRFPLMEVDPGIGLYPVEGVIATIEVKTRLNKKELGIALDNCKSVLDLELGSPALGGFEARVAGLIKENKHRTEQEAKIRAGCELMPATYIFSFSGLNPKKICEYTDNWFTANSLPVLKIGNKSGWCPGLPRVLVSGNSIGAMNDGWFSMVLSADDETKLQACERLMMSFWKTQVPYWWLATHIVHTVCCRLGMRHASSGHRYRIDHYIDRPETIDEFQFFRADSTHFGAE